MSKKKPVKTSKDKLPPTPLSYQPKPQITPVRASKVKRSKSPYIDQYKEQIAKITPSKELQAKTWDYVSNHLLKFKQLLDPASAVRAVHGMLLLQELRSIKT